MTETISLQNTRFGSITLPLKQVIHFDAGLLGLPGSRRYALLSLSPHVYWLQSVDEMELALPMIPANEYAADYWQEAGLHEAAHETMQASEDDVMAFLVLTVTTAQPPSLNLRAPVLIDPKRARGCQILLENNKLALEAKLPAHPMTMNAQSNPSTQPTQLHP